MGNRYTAEELAGAVRRAGTIGEVLRALGAEPTRGRREYVRRLMKAWHIDGSHLRSAAERHTEAELAAAADASASVGDVVRRLGISPVGGNRAHIANRLKCLGIDTSHFATRPTAAGGSVPLRGTRAAGRPLVRGARDGGRVPGARLRRALLERGVPEVCAACGTGPVRNGRPLRLEVDHVNGEWWDNRPSNLRLLCPNCHAVTGTYRGRGRAGGR